MTGCSVFGCKKRSDTSSVQKDNVTFHLFPKDPIRRQQWIKACENHRTWLPKRTSKVCSDHFDTSCFLLLANNKRKLKESATPTFKLPNADFEKPTDCQPAKKMRFESETSASSPPHSSTFRSELSTNHVSPTTSTNVSCYKLDQETPRKRKLRRILVQKNKQIKRLQSKTRYLKKKVASLKEILDEISCF
ncbi:THAP domain-containing protein 2-like [Pieris rapae]|uniref:THAP domain-containing protein 2-like n=1 Tax=Pieris rapae TaxID=64459 RepID=UPI001E27FE68|nr:THAP domain-containing protein 2-like [Pieris rapae]